MLPWQELGRAAMPGGGELLLRGRNGVFEIRIDGVELMSSRAHGSEAALAELACGTLAMPAPRILIGGLGMGYTLRAALDRLRAGAEVVVAELVPEVVAWNRGPLAALAGQPLADPRVTVRIDDIGCVLQAEPGGFDAILLDVDNGPDVIIRAGNAGLYKGDGLQQLARALRPGGGVAVWSADRCDGFVDRLAAAGFDARIIEVPARGAGGGPDHAIVLASWSHARSQFVYQSC